MSRISVQTKHVAEQQIASVRRFVRDQREIREEIATLQDRLGAHCTGTPLCLFYAQDEEKGFDVEIAIPVTEGMMIPGVATRRLPEDDLLCVVHVGPYETSEVGPGLIETVERLRGFIAEHVVLVGDNPSRYVYLEGPETHGEDATRYVTEIQISYHLPVWLDRLREGVERETDGPTADAVMAGSEGLSEAFDPEATRAWVLAVMTRLDAEIPAERTRACILNDCAHRYPRHQLERLRRAYEDDGNLRGFLARLADDKRLFPARISLDESSPTPVAIIERAVPPWNRDAYDAASNPVEKRFHRCFCVMVREAIRRGEPVSPTFCHCSAGWFVQMWEAILDRRLRIDVLRSVLRGDEDCAFAVHLPPKLL